MRKQERTQEQIESFKRLENEVAAMKRRTGHPPQIGAFDETHGMRNVTQVSDNIDDLKVLLAEKRKVWDEFTERLKIDLHDLDPEFCVEHEDVRLEVDYDKTFSATWFHEEKKLSPRYKGCAECEAIISSSLVNEKWRRMGAPRKVEHATIENFHTDTEQKERVLSKVKKFLKRGGGFLIFRGEVGTGKSHLATAIMKEGGGGYFVTELDLLAEFRSTYGGKGDENAVIDKYRDCKVLVLDELSAEVKGTDIAGLLYRILADRYDKGLLTVITSNEKLDAILDILGVRLADRIKHSYYVATFDWGSARKSD